MICIGEKCSSYNTDYFYPTCLETNCRINKGAKCNLLENIKKSRDELIRKCRLFEDIFEIDVEDWNDSIDKIRPE